MPAILARARVCETGHILPNEYLKRDLALFIDAQWSWTTVEADAWRWPTYPEAQAAARADHMWADESGRLHEPFAIPVKAGPSPALVERREHQLDQVEREARDAREADPVALQADAHACPTREPEARAPLAPAKTKPKRSPQRNRRNPYLPDDPPAEPKPVDPRGATAWKKVFRERVSPEECYEKTCAQLGEDPDA